MHDGGRRLRNAYIQQRQLKQPRYRPDTRTDELWDMLADFAMQQGCTDLDVFAEAAFAMVPAGQIVYPNQLKSMKAVEWYQRFVRQRLQGDPGTMQEYLGGGDPDLKVAKHRGNYKQFEKYVRQLTARGQTLSQILRSEFIPFASWFRIAYPVISFMNVAMPASIASEFQTIRERYLEQAREEISRDPHLKLFLEEKQVDVSTLFQR